MVKAMIEHNGKIYLTATEAAAAMNVSKSTISRWIKGGLQTFDLGIGKAKLVRHDELVRWKVKSYWEKTHRGVVASVKRP